MTNTPSTRNEKRSAVNSGARSRASGGGSGKKRIRSRHRQSLPNLQPTQNGTRSASRSERNPCSAKSVLSSALDGARRSPSLGRQSGGGKRRQSIPLAPVGSMEKRKRAGRCGKPEYGWVTAAADHQCNRCPRGVAHSADERLCTACHRGAEEEGFTHLGVQRVRTAEQLVASLPDVEGDPPARMMRSYHPKVGDCLCRRKDCLIHILTKREKKGSQNQKIRLKCVSPHPASGTGPNKRCGRWYSVVADKGGGGKWKSAGVEKGADSRVDEVLCSACFRKEIRGRCCSTSPRATQDGGGFGVVDSSTSSQAQAHGRVDDAGARLDSQPTGRGVSTDEASVTVSAQARAPRVKAASVVRSRVEEAVKKGGVLYCKDVAEWLRAERARLEEDEMKVTSARDKVKQMFHSIARSSGCNARVVDIERGTLLVPERSPRRGCCWARREVE